MPKNKPTLIAISTALTTAQMGTEVGIDGKSERKRSRRRHANQHACKASKTGKHNRLRQELTNHVASSRADGFAHADLMRPLGYGHQHDVHHADAADQQAD